MQPWENRYEDGTACVINVNDENILAIATDTSILVFMIDAYWASRYEKKNMLIQK